MHIWMNGMCVCDKMEGVINGNMIGDDQWIQVVGLDWLDCMVSYISILHAYRLIQIAMLKQVQWLAGYIGIQNNPINHFDYSKRKSPCYILQILTPCDIFIVPNYHLSPYIVQSRLLTVVCYAKFPHLYSGREKIMVILDREKVRRH